MKILFIIIVLLLVASLAQAATRYVATSGATTNCTTMQNIATPASSIAAGVACTGAGDTLYLRTGTYNEGLHASTNGTSISPILYSSYNNETVTLSPTDCAEMGMGNYSTIHGLILDFSNCNGNYVNLLGMGSNQIVENSELKNCPDNCIIVGRTATGTIIRNNLIHDANGSGVPPPLPGSYGVYIEGSSIIVEHNQIYNSSGFGIHIYSGSSTPSNNIVRFNEIYGNCTTSGLESEAGVLLETGDNNQAYGNIVRANHCHGIAAGGSGTNQKIYNNTVYNNEQTGIMVWGVTGASVRNNILVGNNAPFGNINNSTHSNNLCFTAATGCDIVGDPLFTNAAGGDFTLQAGSPAINQGATIGAPYNVDYAGTTRPVSSAYDIGAYEFVQTQRDVAPGKWIPTAAISYDYCDQWTLSYLQSIAKFDLIDGAQLGVVCPTTGMTDVDSWHKYHPSVKTIHYISGINNHNTNKAASLTLGNASGHDLTWLKNNHGISTGSPWFEKGNTYDDYLELGTTDNDPNIYSMNVGASGWWDFIANEAFTWSGNNPYTNDPVTANGSDGVFLDNSDLQRGNYNSYNSYQWGTTNRDYESHYYSGSPGTFNSSQYRTDYLAGINRISQLLSSSSKILVPNIDPVLYTADISATWASLDALTYPPYAAMHEAAHKMNQWGYEGDAFASHLQNLTSLQRTRAYLSFQMNFSGNTDQLSAMSDTDNNSGINGWQALWFYIGNFMLGLNDQRVSGFFGVTVATGNVNAYRNPIYFDEFDPTKLHLGAALASYTTSGSLYLREFDDGWVVVNPTGSTVNNASVPSGQARVINHSNFTNPNSASLVSTFNIPAYTGIILLKENKSITNSDNPNDPGSPTPPPANPQLVLALPLDKGTGVTADDTSGLGNDGTLGAGVLWDNTGKYGKALIFDGTGSVVIQNSNSLNPTAITIEAWAYPTTAASTFSALAVKNYSYYLYGASSTGSCGVANAALSGYFQNGDNHIACDPISALPLNTWTHVAATYNGTDWVHYRNGVVVSSINSPLGLAVSNGTLEIGASQYGERFIGKIDEVRIYNYARTQAEIQTDMNTPLTPAAPGAIIKISPATSLKLSATNGALKVGQ